MKAIFQYNLVFFVTKNNQKIVLTNFNHQKQPMRFFQSYNLQTECVMFPLQKKFMSYQIREFQVLMTQVLQYQNEKLSPFEIQDSFEDIYVFKQNSVHIGVKFRNIKAKNYGFKIKAVEIKIDQQSLDSNEMIEIDSFDTHFRFYQKWKKYEVGFKYKLLKPSVFEDAQELQRLKNKQIQKAEWKNDNQNYQQEINMKFQSYESQLLHLNIQLAKKIKTEFCKIYQLKGEMYRVNFITSWLNQQNTIKELFIINKKKYKMKSWQSGQILVENFSGKIFQIKDHNQKIHQVKALVMETFSEENKKQSFIEAKIDPLTFKNEFKIQQKQLTFDQIYNITDQEQNLVQKHKRGQKYKYNTSYPQLLEDLYKFSISKK